MPFIGDSRRRQLRRLSSRSVSQASTAPKDPTKPGGNSLEDKPVVRQRRMSRVSKHDESKDMLPTSTDSPQARGRTKASSKEHVNVFAFMEKEETSSGTDTEHADSDIPALASCGSSTASSSSEHSPPPQLLSPYSDLEVHAAESKGEFLWYHHRRDASINSESGMSMLSASPVEESPVLGYKGSFQKFDDDTPTTSHTKIMSGLITTAVPETPTAHMNHSPSMELRLMEEPEAYYGSSPYIHPQTPRTAKARIPQPDLQPWWQPSPRQSSPGSIPPPPKAQAQVEKSGYDFLASAIDSRDRRFLTPIYRNFETLKNRILLYLQDEIAEMEDALKRLDTIITQEEGQGTTSRRTEAMYPSQSKWHRQELMCRIFVKVEQYNSALTSYSNLTRSLEQASKFDICAYKDWISEHAPLVEQETHFLHNEADLIIVSQSRTIDPPFPNATPTMMVVVVLLSIVVVFKVVPQLLARVVIALVVGVAALCTLTPNALSDFANIRDSKRAIGVYAAVMLVLALVVG